MRRSALRSVPRRCAPCLGLATLVAACEAPPDAGPDATSDPMVGAALATMEASAAADRAVVRQRAIYPYHFMPETAVLTDHGRHDLRTLASHYVRYAGTINVVQGDASDTLYEARVSSVRYSLQQAGVDPGRVKIRPGLPGGDGMSSSDVRAVLEAAREASEMQSTETKEQTDAMGSYGVR